MIERREGTRDVLGGQRIDDSKYNNRGEKEKEDDSVTSSYSLRSQLFLNLFVALIFRVAEHVIIIRRSPAAADDINVSRIAASRICH